MKIPRAFPFSAFLSASLVTVALAAGCGGSDAVAPKPITGTYALRTVAAKPVPATILDTTYTDPTAGQVHLVAMLTGGTVTLAAASAYSATMNATVFVNGVAQTQSFADAGTYAQTGSTVTFTSSTGQGVTTATLDASGTLTARQDVLGTGVPLTLVFAK